MASNSRIELNSITASVVCENLKFFIDAGFGLEKTPDNINSPDHIFIRTPAFNETGAVITRSLITSILNLTGKSIFPESGK
jgi:hypothetical protein